MKFLVIGNITKDIIRTKNEKKYDFGGTASYGSITAAKLGCETTLLSKGNDELVEWIKFLESHGINIELQISEDVTCFVNDYREDERKQYVLGDAGKIDYKSFGKVDIVFLGPVFNEITLECLKKARNDCKILTLDVQGFVRTLKKREVVKKFWNERYEFLKYVDLLKIGRDEINFVSKETDYENVCEELRSLGVKVVELSLGENGAIILGKEIYRIPAYKTTVIDKTGSGDVFATAFAIKYLESKNELESGLFAAAAASFVVEDFGVKNIVEREKVMKRFEKLAKQLSLKDGMMKIKAILFDVDGVLIDSNRVIIDLFKETAKKMNLKIPSDEDVVSLMGQSLEDIIKFLWSDCDVEVFAKKYREEFVKIKIPTFEGTIEAIEELKKSGFKLGIVSGKKRFYLEKNLKDTGFNLELFDVIISAEDSKEHKPNPKPILIACDKIGVKPKETLYVGDAKFDYEAAKSAKANFVVVNHGLLSKKKLKKIEFKNIIKSVSDLPKFLKV